MIEMASSVRKASIDVTRLLTCGDIAVFWAESKNVKRQRHSRDRYTYPIPNSPCLVRGPFVDVDIIDVIILFNTFNGLLPRIMSNRSLEVIDEFPGVGPCPEPEESAAPRLAPSDRLLLSRQSDRPPTRAPTEGYRVCRYPARREHTRIHHPRPLAGAGWRRPDRQRHFGAGARPDDRLGGAQQRRRHRQPHGGIQVRRFDRGAIFFRHCLTWLEKVDARGAGSALALLYRALAQGARR